MPENKFRFWNTATTDMYVAIISDPALFKKVHWTATHSAPYRKTSNVPATETIRKHLAVSETCPTCHQPMLPSDVNWGQLVSRLVEAGHFDRLAYKFIENLNTKKPDPDHLRSPSRLRRRRKKAAS